MPPWFTALDEMKNALIMDGSAKLSEAEAQEMALMEQVAMNRRLQAVKRARQWETDEGLMELRSDRNDAARAVANGVAQPYTFAGMSPGEIARTVGAGHDMLAKEQWTVKAIARDRAGQAAIADIAQRQSDREGRKVLPPQELWPVEEQIGPHFITEAGMPEQDRDMQLLPRAQPGPAPAVLGGRIDEDDIPFSERFFPQVY